MRGAPNHHDQIQAAAFYIVLAENLSYRSFCAIAIDSFRHVPLGYHDPQPGFFQLIAYKEKLEIPICNAFCSKAMTEAFAARDALRSVKAV